MDRGESVPFLTAFVKRRTNSDGATLRVVAKIKYRSALQKEIQAWSDASGGKVSHRGRPGGCPGAVLIEDATPPTSISWSRTAISA
ncbi:hypothetical protein MHT86_10175 [Corynebacterium mastitidis]|uniref:hypothetical protein n=1 Tax=Corynebacterium mastitidis TaxID=161890 RepID=UPI0012FF4C1E|nr:hypothetical protein [Corynebacterium mastitidis]MCH6197851.1 hypothetical protein [Corynebacterium mastitidis]